MAKRKKNKREESSHENTKKLLELAEKAKEEGFKGDFCSYIAKSAHEGGKDHPSDRALEIAERKLKEIRTDGLAAKLSKEFQSVEIDEGEKTRLDSFEFRSRLEQEKFRRLAKFVLKNYKKKRK